MATIDIKVRTFYTYTPGEFILSFNAALEDLIDVSPGYQRSFTIGASNPSLSIFPTVDDAIAYYQAADGASIVSGINTILGTSFTLGNFVRSEERISRRFSQIESDVSALQSAITRTFTNPTRSLNSAFQVSATKDSIVSYSVDIATALSLTGGQAGTVYLRYADDSGHTTNVKEVCRFASSNTGALTIGLALNQVATGTLSGAIPAGKYAKLVTANDTGTPTFTYRNAQEVLL